VKVGRRIRRLRSGEFQVRLEPEEREVLRSLPGQLRELLHEGDDDSLRRLNPPAYTDEPELEEEYQRLMGDDLRRRRLEALEMMEATVDAERLGEDQLTAWMRSINDMRLVLGTRLGVSEDMAMEVDPLDPRAPALALYGYLSWLEEQVVEALSST
jgi:hypothetical protein